MKRIAIGVALLVVMSVHASTVTDSALDFTSAIYRHLPDYDIAHAPYAPRLAALIARDKACQQNGQGICVLDWSPLCGCQDEGDHYRLTNLRARTTRAGHVSVTVRMWLDRAQTVTLDLQPSGAGWLIADIGRPEVPSLTAHLTRYLPSAEAAARADHAKPK